MQRMHYQKFSLVLGQGARAAAPLISGAAFPRASWGLLRHHSVQGDCQLRKLVQISRSPSNRGMIMSQAKAVAAKQQADQQPRVAVVTTFGCPHCKAAKGALQAAGIAYEELELSGNLEALNTVKQLTGRATVPQVFVGGSLFGGASELLPKLEDGSFQELLASAPAEPLPSEIRQVVQQQSGPAAQGSTSPASPRASTEDQELAEELRRAGVARGAGNHTLILQAVVDWLASSRGLQAEAALQSLARLQSAQLLTVDLPPYSSSTAGHSRHGLAAVPLLGKLLAPAAAKAGPDWGSKDVPIDGALLQAQPEAGLRLVSEGGVPARLGRPLNAHYKWFGPARPAEAVAEDIRRALLQLYDRYTSSDGKKLNYTALRADPDWRRFVDATAELQKVDLFSLPREELMAFAINIYNALVVHALVEVGPATNALQRAKWYSGIRYVIGGFEFSSDEIEHGILRGNTPSPASLWSLVGKPEWAGRPFKQGDPRAQLAVRPVDPRIHFALNCGAASCPAIKVYSPENLDFGLAAAASAFCASEVEVYPERSELSLSMILKWYGGDFGSKRDLLGFLSQYLPPESKQQLEALMARAKDPAHDIKFSFRPYDWSTNSQ